jgi:hypothetical protein
MFYILAARNHGWDLWPGEVGVGVSVILLIAHIWKTNQNS